MAPEEAALPREESPGRSNGLKKNESRKSVPDEALQFAALPSFSATSSVALYHWVYISGVTINLVIST